VFDCTIAFAPTDMFEFAIALYTADSGRSYNRSLYGSMST